MSSINDNHQRIQEQPLDLRKKSTNEELKSVTNSERRDHDSNNASTNVSQNDLINPVPLLRTHQNHRGIKVTDNEHRESTIDPRKNHLKSIFPLKPNIIESIKIQPIKVAGAVKHKNGTVKEASREDQGRCLVQWLSSKKKSVNQKRMQQVKNHVTANTGKPVV